MHRWPEAQPVKEAGVVAETGFEVVHVRLPRYLPLRAGFDAVEAHLKGAGRPLQAVCGMELRSPKPFSFSGFHQFNAGYIDVLKKWDVLFDGMNPVARTNVAPAVNPPGEPSLYGFSYTVPSKAARKTFVVAGAGELPEGSLDPHDVVRRGEHGSAAIREKAHFVMGLMEGRLKGLGAGWSDVTVSEIYTVHDIRPPVGRPPRATVAGRAINPAQAEQVLLRGAHTSSQGAAPAPAGRH